MFISSSFETRLLCLFYLHFRSKELHQVALQVSSIEELLDILQVSITVMQKQWSEAIASFSEKMQGLSQILREHGISFKIYVISIQIL
jgi:hypothetical protein